MALSEVIWRSHDPGLKASQRQRRRMEMYPSPLTIALGEYAGVTPAEIGSFAIHNEVPFKVSRKESHITLHVDLRMLPMREMSRRGTVGIFIVIGTFIVTRAVSHQT